MWFVLPWVYLRCIVPQARLLQCDDSSRRISPERVTKEKTMKRILKFAVLGLALVAAAQGAAAQAKRWLVLKAPFAFTVEHQQLPAGEYRVQLQDGWLRVQSADGKASVYVLTMPVSGKAPEGHGEVLF